MRVHWFSPYPPQRSEIANTSYRLMAVFGRNAEVTYWCPSGAIKSPVVLNGVRVRPIEDPMPWAELNYSDATFYNIGNDGNFHSEILHIARQHPGIVIMHDGNIHLLARHYSREFLSSDNVYLDFLRQYGGEKLLRLGLDHLRGADPSDTISANTLHEVAMLGAAGVICHNPTLVPGWESQIECPMVALPLPYCEKAQMRPYVFRRWDGRRKVRLAVFGFLRGVNRRLKPFLEALSKYKDKGRFEVYVAGEYGPIESMSQYVRSLGLEAQCTLHGYLPEAELKSLLDQTDVAINLRFPSMGEASASALRVWDHSLCALTSHTAWYSTLPSETVLFVDPEKEMESIHASLDYFLNNPVEVYQRGINGRYQLENMHSAEAYVPKVLDFGQIVRNHGRGSGRFSAMRSVAKTLKPIHNLDYVSYGVQRMARELNSWWAESHSD
jgi:glycosyltransferase involved in cell wall biosynthesis